MCFVSVGRFLMLRLTCIVIILEGGKLSRAIRHLKQKPHILHHLHAVFRNILIILLRLGIAILTPRICTYSSELLYYFKIVFISEAVRACNFQNVHCVY